LQQRLTHSGRASRTGLLHARIARDVNLGA
jgi:hypothetical protein